MAWVLVTGGAKRLGADLVRRLAHEGYDVVLHYYRSQDEAEAVAKECRGWGARVETLQGDFSTRTTTEDFISRYTAHFSETYALVNNVGNYMIGKKVPIENVEPLFQTNVFAPYALMQALAPSLERTCGAIVNVGIAGLNSQWADSYSPVYMASKAALLSLTRSLAKELASNGVRVNMVSPGYLDNAVDLPVDLSVLPMGRAASCCEVSRVVAFLLNQESSYVTGQNIDVAGAVRL